MLRTAAVELCAVFCFGVPTNKKQPDLHQSMNHLTDHKQLLSRRTVWVIAPYWPRDILILEKLPFGPLLSNVGHFQITAKVYIPHASFLVHFLIVSWDSNRASVQLYSDPDPCYQAELVWSAPHFQWALWIVVDFMIRLNELVRVGQFAKKSRSFVRSRWIMVLSHRSDSAPPSFSFKRIANAQFKAELVRLRSSLVLILKRITIVQWCKRSSINTTLTKFLLDEELFIFGIVMLLPGWLSWLLSPRVFTAKHSQWTNDDSRVTACLRLVAGAAGVESRWTNDTNETNWSGELGWFVHVKESFVQLIRSRTSRHH